MGFRRRFVQSSRGIVYPRVMAGDRPKDSGDPTERERTDAGVGLAKKAQAPATPIVAVAPIRERTVLGVGAPERGDLPPPAQPPPEDGWDAPAIEHQEAKAESPRAPHVDRSLPSPGAAELPRRRRRLWPALLVVLLAAGCAAYVMRADIPWLASFIDWTCAKVAALAR
jgi:hypothetical protein